MILKAIPFLQKGFRERRLLTKKKGGFQGRGKKIRFPAGASNADILLQEKKCIRVSTTRYRKKGREGDCTPWLAQGPVSSPCAQGKFTAVSVR